MTIKDLTSGAVLLLGLSISSIGLANGEALYNGETLPPNIADQDKDGVVNIRDFCPDTVIGAQVDNDGCPTEAVIDQSINLKVLFDTGRYDVKPTYYPEIQKIATILMSNPNSTVVIEGHTDDVGEADANLTLSKNRVNEIALVLIRQFGVDRNRIRGIGYGETKPIASNEDPEGRFQNRRVIANIYSAQTTQEKRWNIYSVDNMQSPTQAPILSTPSGAFPSNVGGSYSVPSSAPTFENNPTFSPAANQQLNGW